MTKLLMVKGHPMTSKESCSMKGFDAFLQAYQDGHPSDIIEIIDVYKDFVPEIDQDILTGWSKMVDGATLEQLTYDERRKIKRYNELTEQFLLADKIVIANPLWNSFFPPSLMNWFNAIIVAGKTFHYTEEGPSAMAHNKKVLHIQANGGIYRGQDLASRFMRENFHFIGVKDVTQIFVEGHEQYPGKREEIVREFIEKVVKIAIDF